MKKLSRFLLCLMCSGSMIVSSTAINVSAFEQVETEKAISISDDNSRYLRHFSFNGVDDEGENVGTISVSTPRYITIYFSTVSGSDATVLICKSSNNEQVAEFSIPTVGPSSTISTIRYLPSSGSYYFFVIANGSYTSGGFSVDY